MSNEKAACQNSERQPWDKKKGTEIVLYLANRVTPPFRTPGYLCMLLYQADKLHLSRYGRTVSYHEQYYAGPQGNCPRFTEALLKESRTGAFKFDGKHILPERLADSMELSKSDEECLDEVIAESNQKSRRTLRDWRQDWAWGVVTYQGAIFEQNSEPIPITLLGLALSADNAEKVIRFLYDQGNVR